MIKQLFTSKVGSSAALVGAIVAVGSVASVSAAQLTSVNTTNLSGYTKDQCKNGGWEALGFKNQGQCVAFFASGGKNVHNTNTVDVTNTTTQSATSGKATVKGNTTGGNATSGSVSNTATTSTTVKIKN